MKTLQLLLVLGVALSVSACDSNRDERVRRAYITQISIIDAPLFKPNGDRWDGGILPSGPDIFVEVEGASGVELLSSRDIVDADGGSVGVLQDAEASSFPATFVFPNVRETEFNDLNRVLRVELRDADATGSESMLFTDQFTFDEFAPTSAGVTTNFRVESADRTALIQITVDWEN